MVSIAPADSKPEVFNWDSTSMSKSVSISSNLSTEEEVLDSLPSKLRFALFLAVAVYILLSIVLGAMVIKQERFGVCLVVSAMLTVYFLVALLVLELIIRRFHRAPSPPPSEV